MELNKEKVSKMVEHLKAEFAEFKPAIQEVVAEFKDGEYIKCILTAREIVDGMLSVASEAQELVGGMNRKELRAAVVEAANDIVDIPLVPEFAEGIGIGKVYDFVAGKFDATEVDEKSMAAGAVVLERIKKAIALPEA